MRTSRSPRRIHGHVGQRLTSFALQRLQVVQMPLPVGVISQAGRHLRGVIVRVEQLVDELAYLTESRRGRSIYWRQTNPGHWILCVRPSACDDGVRRRRTRA